MKKLTSRPVLSWALYDWANSAFATVVMAGFFPLFFRDYWSKGSESSEITFYLGMGNALASLLIVVMAPVLGAIADSGGWRKKFLAWFALLGIVMTAGMFWVAQGQWQMALLLFSLALIGFMGANIFYDSLLVSVSDEDQLDRTSAWGFSLGYLGGGLLFALCVAVVINHEAFGFSTAADVVRLSFLVVAIWWAVFSIPLFLWVKEKDGKRELSIASTVQQGFRQFVDTFHEIRRYRYVAHFLLAYWLYIDGVDTIVRMAVDYGRALGIDSNDLITALLVTQFVGFPAAIVFGFFGERVGTKRALLVGIGVYIFITIWGSRMDETWEFYGLAVMIGLVQGGVQSLSRSLYARLIPTEKAAEFFGFYNMLGKFAAVIGPMMMGWMAVLTQSPRLSILSLLVLFISGGVLLYFLDVKKGHAAVDRELTDKK
jgi:UMF1 family MFS transporter